MIRVMIVEDSPVTRTLLEAIVNADPRLAAVAVAASAEEALKRLVRTRPDVITMDIHLPGMDGYEATSHIMADHPTPIVVVSASAGTLEAESSMEALRAGALSVVRTPPGPGHPEHGELARRLCDQLVLMSEVRVVRRRSLRRRPRVVAPKPAPGIQGPYDLLGVVASTGGPPALAAILGQLPADYGVPIAVVQHMTPDFVPGFVTWLGGQCRLRVAMALAGQRPAPGTIYVAPPDRHLEITPSGFLCPGGEPVCFQRPSGTVLFSSMARCLGARALGVLLTGMGRDGSVGLLELRRAGGYTIAEHPSTALVDGMPAAAVELGGACEVLPQGEILARLLESAP